MYKIISFFKNKFKEKRNAIRQADYERKNDILYKRHGYEKVLFIIMLIIFIFFAISYIFPFLWMGINAFKKPREFAKDFTGLPKEWVWDNFKRAFEYKNASTRYYTIFEMLGMSVILAFGGTIATVLASSCAAYVVAKYEFRGKSIILGMVIFSMIIPIVGSLPSQIQLMENLGLKDTVIGIIFLYSGGFGMNFMLLYSFFKNLSWTYVEAAKIDGASDARIFFTIIMPMTKGPIIAIAVIALIGLWNDYMTPLIYLPDMPTIAVGLKYLTDALKGGPSSYPLLFATITIAIIPVTIVFSIFSKTIMENTSVGGLKG